MGSPGAIQGFMTLPWLFFPFPIGSTPLGHRFLWMCALTHQVSFRITSGAFYSPFIHLMFYQVLVEEKINILSYLIKIVITEYTQSGDGRFLAYIPSWWKNQLRLARVGGARAPPFTTYIYHHIQSCCVRFSWEVRYTPPISSFYTPM